MAKKKQPGESNQTAESPARAEGAFTQRAAIYCFLLASVVAVYGQVYKYDFVTWDDPINVTQNPLLRPLTLDSIRQFWSAPFAHLYVPVTYTFFAAEAAIASPTSLDPEVRRRSARVFHLGNLLLHLACVFLVFAILRRLVNHDWAAACGALLFGLHPLQAESVSWVTEAKGLLAGLFGFATIWLYLLARDAYVPAAADRRSNRTLGVVYYFAATVTMALALLSKPLAAAIPLMIIALELFLLRPFRWKALLATLPWIAMVLAVALATSSEQSGDVLPYETPLANRPLVAADALGFYLGKLAVPWPLAFDYGRSPEVVIKEAADFSRWLWILPFATLFVALIPKGRRVWLASWGLFTAGVLPVLGFVPFAYQYNSTVADRYVYLALIGPALALAWWLSGNFSSRVKVAGVVLAILAVLSFRQTGHWRDNVALYSHGIAANPTSYIAHNMLGTTYYEKAVKQIAELKRRGIPDSQPVGGVTAAELIDLAEKNFRASIKLRPEHDKAYGNLGLMFLARNQPLRAEEYYRQAVERNKKSIDGYNGLAFALARQGRHEDALAIYRRAIQLAEDVPEEYMKAGSVNVYANKALSLEALQRYSDAAAVYQRILELSPKNASANAKLPLALARSGRPEEAEELCRKMLEKRDDDYVARLNLARVYHLQGNPNAAILEIHRVLDQRPGFAPAHLRLAEVYADLEDDHRVVSHLRAALRKKQALGEELPEAYRMLAWELATSADTDIRNGAEAVELAQAANRATGNRDPVFLDTLAAAYAANRRYDLAANTARLAAEQALSGEQPELLAKVRSRLKLYEDGSPYVRSTRESPGGASRP